jgi:hypothetical protein
MTRSRKILAALGMLLVLALAGCVRFQADLTVSPDDTLDGDIVVAVITDDSAGSADKAQDAAADIEAQLLPALRGSDGVTAEPYEQDDYVGTRFTLADAPLESLNGGESSDALTLTRTGDEFEFSGHVDFTPDQETQAEVDGDAGDADISVSMSFPGEVTDHNGQLEGTRVTWTTSLEGSLDMRATASAVPAPPSPALIALIVGAVVAGIALIVVVIVLILRRRASATR